MAKGRKTGQKTGGRKAGVPNKITADIKALILGALDAVGGQAYLQEQASKNPVAFMALLGKVLPLQVTGEGGGPIVCRIVSYAPSDTDGSPGAL